MQPSQEKIIETVEEVMSQRQFHFEETDSKGTSIRLPDGFGYVFLILILCVSLFFLFKFLKNCFQGSKKRTRAQRETTEEEKKELPLSNRPIEKLHAAFLNSLQNRKIVTLRNWKTNSDYIDESGNSLFQEICSLYDAAVYGEKEISPKSVSLLNEQWTAWEDQQ